MNRGRRGESVFRKNEDYLRFIVTSGRQFGGDRQVIQYYPIQFGHQCCREDEREDIRGPPIEKLCRGDQNRLSDASSVGPFIPCPGKQKTTTGGGNRVAIICCTL